MTAALFPSEFGEAFVEFDVRFAQMRPSGAVYVRRRLVVALVASAMCLLVGLAAHSALADRGGVPASTPAVRSAQSAVFAGSPTALASTALARAYLVQPGDTLWSLAERFHAQRSIADYADHLVSINGGTTLEVGQLLTLP